MYLSRINQTTKLHIKKLVLKNNCMNTAWPTVAYNIEFAFSALEKVSDKHNTNNNNSVSCDTQVSFYCNLLLRVNPSTFQKL